MLLTDLQEFRRTGVDTMVEGIAAMKDASGKFRKYKVRGPEPAWAADFADALTTLAERASIDIHCEPGWVFAEREAFRMAECQKQAKEEYTLHYGSGGGFIPAPSCLNLAAF